MSHTPLHTIYTSRAPTYDTSWHPRHAHNYSLWASPHLQHPGAYVLDLATGTGLVALALLPLVGATGTVVGVDVNAAMLAVARGKAEARGMLGKGVAFVEGDVMDLGPLVEQRVLRREYDLLTCATALVLLPDPAEAVRGWAALLRRGGRLIVDVPTQDSLLAGLVLEEVQRGLGIAVPYYRTWVTGLGSLVSLFEGAGLEVERAWVADGYVGGREYGAGDAGDVWERMVGEGGMLRGFVGERGEEVREGFVEKWRGRVGEDGRFREGDGFFVVIGRKP